MADGDLVAQGNSQYSLAAAEGSGQTFWYGNLRGHCWRKYVAIDGATGAVDGVYCFTGGADYVTIHTSVTTSATVRIWGENTTDGAQPSAATENNQLGANITADSIVTVTEPPEWMKAEATAATGALTVLFEVHYTDGRP